MSLSFSSLDDALQLDPAVDECHARVARRLCDPLIEAELRPRLCAYWDTVRATAPHRRASARTRPPLALNSFAGLFLLVALGEGHPLDERALDGAAACELYTLAISLLDAVQDDELEPPVSELGPALASNAALVMFVQACDGIMELGERLDPAARARVRRTFVARSLVSGAGQHRDLRCAIPATLEDSAAQAQDKTNAIPMTAELAALVAGCDDGRVELYHRIGRRVALVRQCANDLRDLYGKAESSDLSTGKWSLPMVAFWTRADAAARREFERLRAAGPGATEAIRRLLLGAGAIHAVASVMEQARGELHDAIAALGRPDLPIALLGRTTDQLASRLYRQRPAAA